MNMNTQTQDLVNALRDLLAWANIKDGSPSQYLRDNALKAIENANKASESESEIFTLGDDNGRF